MLELLEQISRQLNTTSVLQLKPEVEKFLTNLVLADLEPYLVEPSNGKPYGRKLVYQSSVLEALVMLWSNDQDSLPHNHGASAGWMYVFCGTAKSCIYRFEGNRHVRDTEDILPVGEIAFVPQEIVHSMGNYNKERLITVHLYAPPITRMKVFDADVAYIVSNDCGAWQPQPSQIIKQVELASLRS